jgi:hypothetical protein
MKSTDIQGVSIQRLFYQEGTIPNFYIFPGLQVAKIRGKGLGVTTTIELLKNQILECCPVLLLAPEKNLNKEWARLHRVMLETIFTNYIFDWTPKFRAVALGYGGLYNHSSKPNAKVVRITRVRKMVIVASENITKGSEITIGYRSVWFDPVESGSTGST